MREIHKQRVRWPDKEQVIEQDLALVTAEEWDKICNLPSVAGWLAASFGGYVVILARPVGVVAAADLGGQERPGVSSGEAAPGL